MSDSNFQRQSSGEKKKKRGLNNQLGRQQAQCSLFKKQRTNNSPNYLSVATKDPGTSYATLTDSFRELKLNSGLWVQAVEAIRTTDQWQKYCKILERTNTRLVQKGNSNLLRTDAPPDNEKSVRGIIENTLQLASQASDTKKNMGIKTICSGILKALTSIKDAGPAVAALNPYASLAWSSVQFLFILATNSIEAENLCWNHLPRVIRLICRYQTFEEAYTDSNPSRVTTLLMNEALVALYTSILAYEVAIVIQVESKAQKFKVALKGASASDVQQTINDLQEKEAEVEKVRVISDRVMMIHSIQKLPQEVATEVSELLVKLEEDQATLLDCQNRSNLLLRDMAGSMQDSRYDEILTWISDYKLDHSHNKEEKTALDGTGKWLLTHHDYREWRSSSLSTLWIRGFMGTGKSCLTHCVIEDMKRQLADHHGRSESLIYFYCDASDSYSAQQISDVRSILRCFVKQVALANRSEKVVTMITQAWRDHQHTSDPSGQYLSDLITSLTSDCSTVYVVIDGLDEASPKTQKQLIANLNAFRTVSTSQVKILISGRPSIDHHIDAMPGCVINMTDHNKKDIEKVIASKISDALADVALRRVYVDEPRDQTEAVRDTIHTNAQGMFKWVDLAFDYIHKSKHFDAMRRRLESIHEIKDVFDLYDTIWEDMVAELDEFDQHAIRVLLTSALDPNWCEDRSNYGTRNEGFLCSAINFYNGRFLDQNVRLETLVQMCSSFLYMGTTEPERGTQPELRFQHFTAKTYLEMRHPQWFSKISVAKFLPKHLLGAILVDGAEDPDFQYCAEEDWVYHLDALCHLSTDPKFLEMTLREDAELNRLIYQFILEANPTDAFRKWADHYTESWSFQLGECHMVPELWRSRNSTPTRIYFNIGVDDDVIADTTLDTDYRYSLLSFAAEVGNIEILQRLLKARSWTFLSDTQIKWLGFCAKFQSSRRPCSASPEAITKLLRDHGVLPTT